MMSSDAGALMLLAEADKAICLVVRFAACFRKPLDVLHESRTLIAQRVFGIALCLPHLAPDSWPHSFWPHSFWIATGTAKAPSSSNF